MDDTIESKVIAGYKQGHSLRQIAVDTNLGYSKCRKILITAGLYTSPMADKVRELAEQGLSKEEIAQILRCKPKTIESYIPYTKCVYNSDAPTINAQRIRKHRAKQARQE